MHVAEQALLPAAEAVPGHRHGDGHVDAHHAGLHAARELARDVAVAGEAGHAVAEFVLVDQRDGLGEVLGAHAGEHRAEDLFPVDAHGRRHVVEQRAAGEEAVLVAGHLQAAAVDDELGAFLLAQRDVALDALLRLARDDRAHLGVELHAVLDLERAGALGQLRDDPVADVAHQHRHADGHAAFAGRAVASADQRVHGLLEIRVGHHHHVVLRAAQRLHALAVVRAGLVDVLRDRRRADEAERLHVGVREQRVHRQLVALHDVEDAVGQAGLLEQLGHEQRGGRVALAGLEDEGVAAGDGHREHPARHHAGEVEGRDAGHHAERLAQRPVVDAGADLVGVVALEQLRDAAGELDDVDAARHLALRVGEHLAVLGGDHRGQRVAVLVHQLEEFLHHARAADRRRVGPGREGGAGRGHRRVHLGDAGQRHLARHRAGGRVPDRLLAAAAAGNALSGDEVAHVGGGGEGFGRAHALSPRGRSSDCRRCQKKSPPASQVGCVKSSSKDVVGCGASLSPCCRGRFGPLSARSCVDPV